jgi:amino acid adenylation domain-containing protein
MVLLAAWQAVLARLTGQQTLAVGSPVAGRDRHELEGLIGFFVNLLVLRGDVTGSPTFTELVRRVRGTTLGAFEHQEVPFDKLVEELQPLRDPGHTPLFQVLFVLQSDRNEPLRLPGIELARVPVAGRVSRYDLSLSVADAAGDLTDLMGGLEFSTDLFDAATVERWLGEFQALLASAAVAPGLPWLELSLVQPVERHQILVEWNEVAQPPCAGDFAELWHEQHGRRPDAVALVLGEAQLTYLRLEEEIARQAARFRSLGVGPDSLVALHLERSFEMVACVLAVLRAGGGYLPLDTGLPADRLAFLLADARPCLLVTRGKGRSALPAFSGPVLEVEADFAPGPEPAAPAAAVPDSATAYVIYTSGSTGVPKGSLISRRALDNLARYSVSDFDSRDVILAKSSLSFDVSVLGLFIPLVLGTRVVLAGSGSERDMAEMVRSTVDEQVTILGFTPSAFLGFMAQEDIRACRSIRRWTSGGDAIPPDLLAQIFSRFPGTELRNIYGPTEATVFVSSWTCRPGEADRAIPIGRPQVGAGLYLLDAGFAALPVGVAGELCIGGTCLARGYLRRPELTAEKFIPHPFAPTAGERLYRTGDLARLRSDGALEFLGRIDHQVKIRGFRVELGEIEAALASHPGVHDAVVVVWGEDRLLACIIARDPSVPPASAELSAFVAERLPTYMVPSLFALLPQLPLLSTGKVDRTALARLSAEQLEGRELAGSFVAPQTPVEEAIAAIWAEVLGIDPVRQPLGIRDDFFALGGHSLLAIQVLLQVQRAFSVELPVKVLFENPTIEGVALAVAEQLTAGIDEAEMLQLLAGLD